MESDLPSNLDREPAAIEQPTVLVVDDDGDVRESLSMLLEDGGYRVVLAENGARALSLLIDGLKPTVIVLDMMMPVMSGWDFLEEKAAAPVAIASIPVIALTASGLATGENGNAVLLEKTAPVDVILSTIAAYARRR